MTHKITGSVPAPLYAVRILSLNEALRSSDRVAPVTVNHLFPRQPKLTAFTSNYVLTVFVDIASFLGADGVKIANISVRTRPPNSFEVFQPAISVIEGGKKK